MGLIFLCQIGRSVAIRTGITARNSAVNPGMSSNHLITCTYFHSCSTTAHASPTHQRFSIFECSKCICITSIYNVWYTALADFLSFAFFYSNDKSEEWLLTVTIFVQILRNFEGSFDASLGLQFLSDPLFAWHWWLIAYCHSHSTYYMMYVFLPEYGYQCTKLYVGGE